MKICIKKISISMALLTLSAIGFAEDDLESRITQLETQMGEVQTETALGTYGLNAVSARRGQDTYKWSCSFAPLYWRAKVDKTMFAYPIEKTGFPVKIKTKEIAFNWDWGFRVGLGYRFSHDKWDIKGEYTWFRTNGNDSLVAGMHHHVIPLRGTRRIVRDRDSDLKDNFRFCSTATSDFSICHKGLDVHLGRDYFTTQTLSVRPHLGLKGAWVNQEQVTRYSGGSRIAITRKTLEGSEQFIGHHFGLEGNTVSVKDRCDFRGLGPMIGVTSKWNLGSGIGIFGGLRGGLLFGSFDVKCEQTYSLATNNPIEFDANSRGFLPTTQLHLGLRYDQYFSSGIQHLGIGLGLEEQYFWKQNQVLKMLEIEPMLKTQKSMQDVAFYGLSAQLELDF